MKHCAGCPACWPLAQRERAGQGLQGGSGLLRGSIANSHSHLHPDATLFCSGCGKSLWGQEAEEGFSRRFHEAVLVLRGHGDPRPIMSLSPQTHTSSQTDTEDRFHRLPSPRKHEMCILYYFLKAFVKGFPCATHFLCIILFHSLSDHVR